MTSRLNDTHYLRSVIVNRLWKNEERLLPVDGDSMLTRKMGTNDNVYVSPFVGFTTTNNVLVRNYLSFSAFSSIRRLRALGSDPRELTCPQQRGS
jgi:hypothetical protein